MTNSGRPILYNSVQIWSIQFNYLQFGLIFINFDQFDQFCQMLSHSGSPGGASSEAKRNPWVVQGGPRGTIGAPGGSHGVQGPPKRGPREAIRTAGGVHRVLRKTRPAAKSCQRRTKTGLRRAKTGPLRAPKCVQSESDHEQNTKLKNVKTPLVFPLQMAWQTAQN